MINLFFFMLSISAFAKETEFTTVFYDDAGTVYAGLKQYQDKKVSDLFEAQVVHFPFPKGDVENLNLPEVVQEHDVVGILPDREKLFIISHQSEVIKGGPTVHLYNSKKKKWKEFSIF